MASATTPANSDRNLMDHHFRAGATGRLGRRPRSLLLRAPARNGIYIPALPQSSTATSATTCAASATRAARAAARLAARRGRALLRRRAQERAHRRPASGRWASAVSARRCPTSDNRMWLDKTTRDKWGHARKQWNLYLMLFWKSHFGSQPATFLRNCWRAGTPFNFSGSLLRNPVQRVVCIRMVELRAFR